MFCNCKVIRSLEKGGIREVLPKVLSMAQLCQLLSVINERYRN